LRVLHPSIAIHQDEIIRLCKEYGVSRLEILGSAITDAFDPERSDVDFLVEFSARFDYDRYFELIDDLERILGRSVQLVTRKYLRNPYFIHAVETTKLPLYAA
jgi:predicted nucleotidyltransferase